MQLAVMNIDRYISQIRLSFLLWLYRMVLTANMGRAWCDFFTVIRCQKSALRGNIGQIRKGSFNC